MFQLVGCGWCVTPMVPDWHNQTRRSTRVLTFSLVAFTANFESLALDATTQVYKVEAWQPQSSSYTRNSPSNTVPGGCEVTVN